MNSVSWVKQKIQINSVCWGKQKIQRDITPSMGGEFYQIQNRFFKKKQLFKPMISDTLLFKRMYIKKKEKGQLMSIEKNSMKAVLRSIQNMKMVPKITEV